MSLFDDLVNEALRSRADLATLRPVVEKELLHHDILREMSGAGLLAGLTFIGGTCLRACYGSPRLMPGMKQDFLREIQRFLPAATVRDTLENPGYWDYLIQLLKEQCTMAVNALK